MVIFGAGASFDSVDPANLGAGKDERLRPPLARQLFDPRDNFGRVIQSYWECQPIIANLRDGLREGREVESMLEQLKVDATEYPMNHRYLAAVQFYLREVLWECGYMWSQDAYGVTNYATLLDQINRWRVNHSPDDPVCLVTFNYDTMLDRACRPFGLQPKDIDSYLGWNGFALLKPHGSVDWAIVVDEESLGGRREETEHRLIADAPVSLTNRYVVLDESRAWTHKEMTDQLKVVRPLYPAIAIPVERKDADSFAFPDSHLEELKGLVPRVKKLLVIGWRGTEEHFLALWANAGSRVDLAIVVDKEQDHSRAIMERLKTAKVVDNVTVEVALSGGFTEFVRRGADIQRILQAETAPVSER